MIPRSALLALCAGLWLALPALAQQAPAPPKLVVDDNYRISPGDVLVLTVLGEEKLSGPLTVGAGGSIALPMVGSIQVVGKTLRGARDLIAQTYRDVIIEPFVSVALDEIASKRRVYVGGTVEKPGSVMMPLGSTPAEAIVAAGLVDDSDLARVTLRKADGSALSLDLTGLRTQEVLQINVYLDFDDRLYVPSRESRLTILGQVTKPGSYTMPYSRKIYVVDLLTQIGGGLTETADRRVAMLIRDGGKETIEIDLQALLDKGDLRQNRELQGGDVLVIPEADRVTVAGEVAQPASFYGGPRLTLLEALVKVGGFTPLAGLKNAQVKKRGGEARQVNLEALWRNGDLSGNMLLEAGDVVLVPRADPEEVLVTGAVQKAGTVDLKDQKDRSLLKILASMGKLPTSDFSRVNIYRADGLKVANAQAAMELGEMRHNVQLEPGDVVFVPDIGKVALMGAFGRPGLVDFDPKLTLLDYIALGGISNPQTAILNRGALIRTRPDGTHESITLDISRLRDGIVPETVKVKPGDVIFFEGRQPKRSTWDTIRDLLWTFGAVESLFN